MKFTIEEIETKLKEKYPFKDTEEAVEIVIGLILELKILQGICKDLKRKIQGA